MSFQDKVAVITGAGGDVGGAAAEALAAQGAAVVAVDRNRQGLDALKARLAAGARILAVEADVANEAQVEAYVREAVEAFGRIDLFFNNAGIEGSRTGAWCPIPDLSLEDFEQIMAVNATGVFLGLKHVMPVMARGGGGAIVNTSSIYGLKGGRNQVAYVASKHAVRAMTVTTAKEGAADGIRVNAISPGPMKTLAGAAIGGARATFRHTEANAPLRSNATLAAVGGTAVWLASDAGAFTTGEIVRVDGGFHVLGMPQAENL